VSGKVNKTAAKVEEIDKKVRLEGCWFFPRRPV
jgi:hypothetical protein